MGIERGMSGGDTVNYYTTNVVKGAKDNTGLIQLEDGSLIEVEMPEYKASEISFGFAQPALSTFSRVEGILCSAAEPIVKAVKRISRSEQVEVTAELELGLSFEAEGNVYVTKDKSESNLVVKLSIRVDSQASQ